MNIKEAKKEIEKCIEKLNSEKRPLCPEAIIMYCATKDNPQTLNNLEEAIITFKDYLERAQKVYDGIVEINVKCYNEQLKFLTK